MALKTFKNLKQERQEEILLIAFEEFALKGFDNASLSAIIKKCGLAKGSFYRYFSNKRDLYIYLIETASKKRLVNLEYLIMDDSIDFYSLLKENFMQKIQFDLDHPVIGGFLFKIMHEKDNEAVADIIGQMRDGIVQKTISILKLPKYQLNIKNDDLHLVAYHIFQMQLWLYEYIGLAHQIDFKENIKNQQPIINVSKEEVEHVVDKSIGLLKDGIENENL